MYANNNDYIKLEVDDASLNSIIVNVNGKQQSLGVRNQQETERNGIIVYSDKSNYRYKNCYIPVSKLNGLNKQGVNTISFVIKSHNNTKSEEAYLLDSKIIIVIYSTIPKIKMILLCLSLPHHNMLMRMAKNIMGDHLFGRDCNYHKR